MFLNRFRSLALTVLCLAGIVQAQSTPDSFRYEDPATNVEQMESLAGVTDLIARLRDNVDHANDNKKLDSLLIRQEILEHITGASLQADAAIARIDGETAQANEYRNVLSEHRDRLENRLNVAGIATGGALGVVSSALQLSAKHAAAGNSVGIGAGVIVTAISAFSIRAQNGRRQSFAFRSNMLAPLLGRRTDSGDVYSPAVLAFLDSVPSIDPDHLTRKQRLLKTWQEVGRLPSEEGSKREQKINRLTELSEAGQALGIDDLYDRRAMLEDLRAKLALMKRDLAGVLMSLPPSALAK